MRYEEAFPYYAEFCALSELRKKPGFGVPIRSGMGGHLILYLNGVQVRREDGYPVLEICDETRNPGAHGAAISVNAHFRNANWIPVEGRQFFLSGLASEGKLDRAVYRRTQDHARQLGIYDGIDLHPRYYRGKPASMSMEDFKYEIAIGTDYAVRFGRDSYRVKLPLKRDELEKIVGYLNALNDPFRHGKKNYTWNLINNNCVHVVHNALSAAGFWRPWPIGMFPGLAVFRFPVPKNAFIDLALRANDLQVEKPRHLYRDFSARHSLLRNGTLPVRPGALCALERALPDNDLYDVRRLKLIFYDNPFWGAYKYHLRRIVREPRYMDLEANLAYFRSRYQKARASMPKYRMIPDDFRLAYERHIDHSLSNLAHILDRKS